MDVIDPMRSVGRRFLRVAAVAAVAVVAVVVGPVGSAMAANDPPHVTITSPLNGSVINQTPSFSGTADVSPEEDEAGGPVTLVIYRGSGVGGPVIQGPFTPLQVPAGEDSGTWSQVLPEPLPDGTYTAQATQPNTLIPSEIASESVTFTVNTATSSPPTGVTEPPSSVTPSAAPLAPPPLAASFSWFPSAPEVGQSVSLVSTSTDLASPITAFAWALTGGGAFHAGGPLLTTSFSTPGAHVVRLRVTDANGRSNVATETIQVVSASAVLMQPFPIVRFAGSETSAGVHLRLLTVQTPVGARVTVSCSGRGCPTKSEGQIALSRTRNAGTVVVRFRRFERSLRAGVILEIRISKRGEIGKFTRFAVRRGKLPERVDMCLDAVGVSPLACPSS